MKGIGHGMKFRMRNWGQGFRIWDRDRRQDWSLKILLGRLRIWDRSLEREGYNCRMRSGIRSLVCYGFRICGWILEIRILGL